MANHRNVSSLLREQTNEPTHLLLEVQRPSQTQRLHTVLDNAIHQGGAAKEASDCRVDAGRTVGSFGVVDNVGWNAIG